MDEIKKIADEFHESARASLEDWKRNQAIQDAAFDRLISEIRAIRMEVEELEARLSGRV